MAFEVLEAPVERDAQGAGRKAGPILRVGIPTTGGRILKAAKDAGYSVLFSTNAFMVRDGNGDVVGVRRPDPKQFAGLDAALDSAGFVAMAKYRGFPWTIDQYLDLVGSWPWSWYAGVIELVCGALIALGLFTRPAAFLASGTMAAAYFIAHHPQNFFPINNGGDAAILYCFVFLYLVFAGPGAFSLGGAKRG